MPCSGSNVELCTTCHRKVKVLSMALDPNYDYVLADSLTFTNDFGQAPPPPPATSRLMPSSVVAETPLKVNFTFDAHDPNIAKVPDKILTVYVPYPLEVDPLTAEYLLDDANAFPTASVDVAIGDATQPSIIPVEYTGSSIYGQRGCQVVYAFRK